MIIYPSIYIYMGDHKGNFSKNRYFDRAKNAHVYIMLTI